MQDHVNVDLLEPSKLHVALGKGPELAPGAASAALPQLRPLKLHMATNQVFCRWPKATDEILEKMSAIRVFATDLASSGTSQHTTPNSYQL